MQRELILTSGPDYQHELELLQDAGIAAIDVLRAATYNGAIFLSKEKELGSLANDKIADFILLDEDPTLDIRNIKSVWSVIKNGETIDRERLDLPVNYPSRQTQA